jgi:DNA sulfur modification protein DndB
MSVRRARPRRPQFTFTGVKGQSGGREVFLGFAKARVLYAASFADVLDEDTGRGYQRRPNPQHSQDFRRYIQKAGSATIPLTFNARPPADGAWAISTSGLNAHLSIALDAGPVLARVDCQHRLGHLADLDVSLPFMCFLGLSAREEMEIFRVINSKAKGLSTSLLDFHAATLAADLAAERPELLIALELHDESTSPWYRQLDLGGHSTSGLHRRASLRTMQKAIRRFLNQTQILRKATPEQAAQVVLEFWQAVKEILSQAWSEPRAHLLNKGVGVYALMTVAGDLVCGSGDRACDKRFFVEHLVDYLPQIDWSSSGPLKGLGGEAGVKEAVATLRAARARRLLRTASDHG